MLRLSRTSAKKRFLKACWQTRESGVAKTAEYLRPEQLGVQVPNAEETAARKVRLWTQEAKSDEVLLQVDMRNAFGSVDRCWHR